MFALVILFSVTSGGVWISTTSLSSVLHTTALLAILAMGEALVICSGEIDISVGSVFAMGAFVFLGFATKIGVLPAVLLGVAAGLLIGIFNGCLVTYIRIPSLIVTLGSLFIFRGLAYMLSEGQPFTIDTEIRGKLTFYQLFGGGQIFGTQDSVLWMLGIALFLHLLMFFTSLGNRLLALGGDAKSALSRGVSVNAIKCFAFTTSGALAAFSGILEANKLGFADGTFGRLIEMEAIAAAVIGGCVLSGGRISIVGALLAAFILSGIQSYLVIMGISPQWYLLVLALLVVGASIGNIKFRQWVAKHR